MSRFYGLIIAVTPMLFLLALPAMAETRSWRAPQISGYPVDATPAEWNGQDETNAVAAAAHLFCRRANYSYAIRWSLERDQDVTENGTMRLSSRGGAPSLCETCRWNLAKITCGRMP